MCTSSHLLDIVKYSQDCVIFYSLQQSLASPVFLIFCQLLILPDLTVSAKLMDVLWFAIAVLICTSVISNKVEHFF